MKYYNYKKYFLKFRIQLESLHHNHKEGSFLVDLIVVPMSELDPFDWNNAENKE